MSQNQPGLLDTLLGLEVAAGRIEGAFAADPDLGRLWRMQAALSEACRSVGLEDIHLSEGDLALRAFETPLTAFEPARGGWHAERLLRVIVAPGDIAAEPGATIARCLRAGLVDDGEAAGTPEDLDILARDVAVAVAAAATPCLAGIRAAALVRAATGGTQPSAERLVFLAADHALRRGRAGGRGPSPGEGAEGILPALSADWVLLPSMALSAQGFRAWSPLSPTGIADLLSGLRIETGRTLGDLPVLRRWRDRAQGACSGRHGKSRLSDLVALCLRRPILTGRGIADALAVTDRTARNLTAEAVEAGILAQLTPRRTYRAWAPVPLADRLRRRSQPVARSVTVSRAGPTRDALSVDAALADLDAALAQADRVLARYGTRDGT
ncbi:helix-turn-helix domain-containing protein [Roseivivax isoporae]|uniref:HTH DNA binding domain-containing protein n=1 Tax=Roseivivax isoporae LMG 25204 TaxID=1449351 RepID=X7FBG4_9RHOB|nr:helix-turn-helix domain-containing protein [Roseivivax isoporae]ETX30252.1 hypothetical protein RISW2_15570 [Roseivivax isoporae LMG 25204]